MVSETLQGCSRGLRGFHFTFFFFFFRQRELQPYVLAQEISGCFMGFQESSMLFQVRARRFQGVAGKFKDASGGFILFPFGFLGYSWVVP